MEYLIILFLTSLSCFLTILNGLAFKKLLKFENLEEDISEAGLYGILLISFLTFIINFFYKISSTLSLIILFLPILFILKETFHQKKKILLYSILFGSISSIIMFTDNTNRPDAGLYHLPYTNIINHSKIILGVANLEFRFGHSSILQYFSAAFNNIIFSDKGILIPLANIFSITVIYFVNLIRKNNYQLKIIFFIFLFNILYSMNRYSGFGNDDPAHMFFYLCFVNYIIIFFNNENDNKKNVLFFALFAFLIKPFLILVFLFPLILLFYKKIKFISGINIICSLLILLWFIKNILISSCILYPEPKTCFKSLEWSTYYSSVSNPERVKRTSEAWSKNWNNYVPNNKTNFKQSDYIKEFNWIETWRNDHFKVFFKEIFPQILLIIFFIFIKPRSEEIGILNKKISFQIFLIGLFSTTLWFLKFPIYRYGQAYVILFINSFLLISLSSYYGFLKLKTKVIKHVIMGLIILLSLGAIIKNLIRINENYYIKYIDYPWPKMNSFTKNNSKNTNFPIKSKNGDLMYYKPTPYSLCMNSKSPCTSNVDVGEIKKKNKYGYIIYYYEN